MPPRVEASVRGSMREYWRNRLEQTPYDTYAGVPLVKFPEDLRVYEHLIWESRANVVVELGVYLGGSALWFRDRLETMARYGRFDAEPRVVGIDVDVDAARELLGLSAAWGRAISLVEGDLRDPGLPERVAGEIPAGSRCLVVDDSAHSYETALAALRGFHSLVPETGFFVVEDGVVDDDDLRVRADWPRGVHRALEAWMAEQGEAAGFRRRPDLERYGVTTNVGGYLERRPGSAAAADS